MRRGRRRRPREPAARLICNTLAEGHRVPSHQRYCGDCRTGVWVSAEMTPVVDSGEATPTCGPCWTGYDSDDGVYALHPRQLRGLAESDVLDLAYQFISEMNTPGSPTTVDLLRHLRQGKK